MELVDKNSELAKRIDAQYSLSAKIRAPFLEQAIAIDRILAEVYLEANEENIIEGKFSDDTELFYTPHLVIL